MAGTINHSIRVPMKSVRHAKGRWDETGGNQEEEET
jgi:hypothetical protein